MKLTTKNELTEAEETLPCGKPARMVAARVIERIEWPTLPNCKLFYVYVFQCVETTLLKIGIAEDWERRLKDIQSTSPTKLQVPFLFVAESRDFETYLHRKFKPYRKHGEWFQPSDEVIETLEKLQAEFDAANL